VMETALDPAVGGVARRAGAIRTRKVSRRTTVLLLRFRHDVVTRRAGNESRQLAEECGLVAFRGAPEEAQWIDADEAGALLSATPDAHVLPEQASGFVRRVVEGLGALRPPLDAEAPRRAETLLPLHRRVREGTRERWLLILFQELGYGRLPVARLPEIDGKAFPVSHLWQQTPIHLVGCGVDLDHRTAGVAGAARTPPHGLVQELLNRRDDFLWG